ncbi:MAG: inorganic diphosphatase [Comamonadaceae bacterium]|nr:inorganic diphosphatase [Comamonadaceae bacterium]
MNITRRLALQVCIAALLGAGLMNVTAQMQGYATEHVSVLRGERNYLTGYDPINLDGTYNVVIEIPAGTTAKYETNNKTGMLELEQKGGAPRYVQYLGYPVNYGAIPRSVMLKSKGGDGDSVDVLVLGQAVPRGRGARACHRCAEPDRHGRGGRQGGGGDGKLALCQDQEHRRTRCEVPGRDVHPPDVVHEDRHRPSN